MAGSETGLRPPVQQRSRESLERVLRAAEQLLAVRGYDGFTVAEVSRAAKVSVGTVYGRFGNKEALVHEMHRRLLERLTPSADDAAAETPDLRAAVGRATRRLADSTDRERDLLRAFMLRGPVDARIAARGSEASQAVGRVFRGTILAHVAEIGHPDPELAADIAYRMVYDVLGRHIMYGATFESDSERTWAELVDELGEAALAYLRFGRRPSAD